MIEIFASKTEYLNFQISIYSKSVNYEDVLSWRELLFYILISLPFNLKFYDF